MSNPASDEHIAALSSKLSSYPQSTTTEPGVSPIEYTLSCSGSAPYRVS